MSIACAYLAAWHRSNWLPSQHHSLFGDHCTLCGRASSPSAAVSGSPPCARPWRARIRPAVDGETHPPFQLPAAVSELAMRQIDLAPLLERLDHAASPHSRMQWIGLPPGGWSSRRLVVRRCRQRRTRCRSSLSVGPLWLRVPSHRTGIRPARDRLSTRTRCRPDSALSDALVGGRSTVGRCHRSPTRAVFRGLATRVADRTSSRVVLSSPTPADGRA